MNPLPHEVWQRGLSYADYRATVKRNAEEFDEAWESGIPGPAEIARLEKLPPQRVVAIGEDWCPDVYHTLPCWARAVERLSGWQLRVYPRDEHLALMDFFLWHGTSRRIPVYAFYDARGGLQTWWSGRGTIAQRAVTAHMAGRTFADLAPEEQRQAAQFLDEGYRKTFRRRNFEEIVSLLSTFFHQE